MRVTSVLTSPDLSFVSLESVLEKSPSIFRFKVCRAAVGADYHTTAR